MQSVGAHAMYLCVECMSVYPVYFELLLPPLLRVAAGFFELLLVTWCGVVPRPISCMHVKGDA